MGTNELPYGNVTGKSGSEGKSNSESQKVEANAGAYISQLNHRHEETMADKEHQFQKEMLDKKLGSLGRFFGQKEMIPLNVAGLLILMLVTFLVLISLKIFCSHTTDIDTITTLWDIGVPIITLALGYLFGIKSNS